MAQRNVSKIEWATRLAVAAPTPAPAADPLPDETPLETVLEPLDFAPLRKADILTAGAARAAGELTSIKGVGPSRAQKILDAIWATQAPATAPAAQHDPQPMLDAFKAIDAALEVSKTLLILSTGYPRVVTVADKAYIVIRFGLCTRYTYFLDVLRRQDPRWHACPPLSVHDTGMIECANPGELK